MTMIDALPPIGHNSGHDPLDDEIRAIVGPLSAEIDERAAQAARAKVTDDDEAGRAATLAKLLADIAKAADEQRVKLKAPYLDAGKKIDAAFKPLTEACDKVKRQVVALIDAYRREQEAKAAEARRAAEAEARAREEAARAAEAEGRAVEAARAAAEAEAARERAEMVAAPAAIRSQYGQVASTRKEWRFTIADRRKLPKAVLDHPKVIEAVEAVVASMVRGGAREIPGVQIFETSKTVVR